MLSCCCPSDRASNSDQLILFSVGTSDIATNQQGFLWEPVTHFASHFSSGCTNGWLSLSIDLTRSLNLLHINMTSKLKEYVLQSRLSTLSFQETVPRTYSRPIETFSSHYLIFPFRSFQLLGFSVNHNLREIHTPIYLTFLVTWTRIHLNTEYPLCSLSARPGPHLTLRGHTKLNKV